MRLRELADKVGGDFDDTGEGLWMSRTNARPKPHVL